MKKHAAPLIAAVLLLLPVLYVASYLALVVPAGRTVWATPGCSPYICHYRMGEEIAPKIYWPLEQIDRKFRRGAWAESLDANFVTPRITLGDDGEPIGIEIE
jgi:hypothetical protein